MGDSIHAHCTCIKGAAGGLRQEKNNYRGDKFYMNIKTYCNLCLMVQASFILFKDQT